VGTEAPSFYARKVGYADIGYVIIEAIIEIRLCPIMRKTIKIRSRKCMIQWVNRHRRGGG